MNTKKYANYIMEGLYRVHILYIRREINLIFRQFIGLQRWHNC